MPVLFINGCRFRAGCYRKRRGENFYIKFSPCYLSALLTARPSPVRVSSVMNEHQAAIMVGQTGLLKRMVWYRCSCGKSGSARKNRNQAMTEHRRHVERESAIDRDCRLRNAAPALLAALEAIVPWLEQRPAGLHPECVPWLEQARAAIAQAEAGE